MARNLLVKTISSDVCLSTFWPILDEVAWIKLKMQKFFLNTMQKISPENSLPLPRNPK